jgi:DNA-binding NarL/FixJ family response regulator
MAHASSDTAPATALRVVVVDDSQTLRTRVRLALERAGLTVVGEAADGAQALTQAAAHHPDVVLMDLRMPRMDGIQATRILRRQQPDTPVVLWTGDDDAQLASAIGESGAHAGVAKGIGTVQLVATLRGVCDAQDQTRPDADVRDGGADPRPVDAPAPPAHASASAGSYLEQSPSGAARADPPILQRHRRAEPAAEGIGAAERAALEQLEAAHGYATRWPVGRQITRSLVKRQLVVVASDYVLLTEAGRRALTIDSRRQSRSAPPDPGRADHGGPTRPAAG